MKKACQAVMILVLASAMLASVVGSAWADMFYNPWEPGFKVFEVNKIRPFQPAAPQAGSHPSEYQPPVYRPDVSNQPPATPRAPYFNCWGNDGKGVRACW